MRAQISLVLQDVKVDLGSYVGGGIDGLKEKIWTSDSRQIHLGQDPNKRMRGNIEDR